MKYVLGLDLGTSGLKGLLVNKLGEIVYTATASYPLLTPKRGYSEQNPDDWFSASKKVIKEIIKTVPDAPRELSGISFSGQMHSLVLLDKDKKPLRNAILWNDVRTTKQCEYITETLGEDLNNITKNKALEGFTLPKMLWIQENEPEIWEQAAHFLLPKDYLRYLFTGTLNMDYSDAAGTLLLDVTKSEWSDLILNKFDIDSSICPELVESTAQVGIVENELSKELGLEVDVPVFAGGADNACGAIGSGIISSDKAMASIGTSGVFLSYEEDSERDYDGHLHFFNHAVENNHYSMGVTLAAGNSLSWFKNTFGPNESYEQLLKNISDIEPGSEGLLFTPYITGERTPYTDSDIRGSFIGMDITHNRNHFARAVLEGITFSLRDSQEIMHKSFNKEFQQIVSVGGGAKNKTWLQMQADIFNAPIVTLTTEQGPGMGAAMIAAVGAGWFNDFKECAEVFVGYQDEITPDLKNVELYNKVYNAYRQIYAATKPISDELAAIKNN